MKRIFILTASLFLTHSALASNVTNIESSGNLGSTHELDCVSADKINHKYTPVDLYKAAAKCIAQNNYADAAFLYRLAGIYGYFDTLRVSDQTAHQAITVLKMYQFENVDETQRKKMQQAMDDLKVGDLCQKVIKIGIPDYYPTYMIQHGMSAILHDNSDAITKDFNAKEAWGKTLSLAGCPGYDKKNVNQK